MQVREILLIAAQEKVDDGDREAAMDDYRHVAYDQDGRLIDDSLSGRALHKLAASNFILDRTDLKTAKYYQLALGIRQSLFPNSHPDVVRTQSNLAYTYLKWGQLDSALYYQNNVLNAISSGEEQDTVMWVRTLSDLADLAFQRRDRQLLLDASQRLDRLLQRPINDMAGWEKIAHRYNLALRHSRLELSTSALYHADIALDYSREINEPYYVAGIHNTRYIAYYYDGQLRKARKSLQAAIDAQSERYDLQWYLTNYAFLEAKLHNYGSVITIVSDLITWPEVDGPILALLHNLMAVAHHHLENNDKAEFHFAESIRRIATNAVREIDNAPTLIPDSLSPEQQYQYSKLLTDRAAYYTTVGRFQPAYDDYLYTIDLIDSLRGYVNSNESSRQISRRVRGVYDEAVAVAVKLHHGSGDTTQLWQAFHLSDRARAYSLNQQLQRTRDEISPEESRLEKEVALLEAAAATDSTKTDRLSETRLRLQRIRAGKQRRPPTLPALTKDDVTAYARQANCHILQFHIGPSKTLIFGVSPEGAITVTEREISADAIVASIQDFRKALYDSRYRSKSLRPAAEQSVLDQTYLTTGKRLSEVLLPDNLPRSAALLIIPDGSLNALPFAALPLAEQASPVRYAQLTYLGAERDLRYAYSLSMLLRAKRDDAPERQTAIAVAPQFGGTLSPLRFNETEAKRVSASLSAENTFLGPEATKDQALSHTEGASVVHFSTHGVSNITAPELSYVAFSQTADTLVPGQTLYYPEISTLDLDADLVALSACETHLGQYVPGETSLTMASAFTAAGARATLTSLWKVDDEATSELMQVFYDEVSKGRLLSVALREAQQRVAARPAYSHPYYWAGFVLTGHDTTISVRRPGNYLLYGAGALLLFGAGALVWQARKK